MTIANVLASRYASRQTQEIWSPEHKVVAERRLWIAVLAAQAELGIDIPAGVIADYERVVDDVDLVSIAERERRTRHDVKARIDEFCALAGHEHIHKGMTSRDLTENVEQLQIRDSMLVVRVRLVASIARLGELGGAAPGSRADRTQPQRARPGHHARQEVRLDRRRDAPRPGQARRPPRPLSAARNQGSGRHRPGPARPARRRPGQAGRSRAVGGPSPRVRPRADQRRPGLSALARLRRGLGARAVRCWSEQPRHDHPADGRSGARDRGLPARPGRLQRDAAQDEHTFVRAGQRAGGDPARSPLDDR